MKIALATAGLVLGASLTALLWADATFGEDAPLGETISLTIAFLSFFAVGVAIVLRRPAHPIGWLFVVAGVYPLAQEALNRLGEIRIDQGGSETLYVIANTAFSWPALLGTLVVFVPLLFPDGRLPSPRWRWLAGMTGLAMAVMVLGGMFQRDICVKYDEADNCTQRIDNPIGLSWLPGLEESAIGAVMFGVLAVGMVGAVVSVVVRYRRSWGPERAQLRWVTFAMALFIAYVLLVGVLVEEVLGWSDRLQAIVPFGLDLFGVFLALVPISVGVAILRYRLYDIDRIISRTVAYGLITAVLVGAYAGVVFVLGRALPGQSDLAVAASTLAVAALFNPVRRRVQALVDRRFNRSRYDSERVIDAFGQRLRSEVSLSDLSEDLVEVAGTTMQPAWTSLWLRQEE
ncbi:MAG TPA: hypothetical protein VHL52_06930 [Acidimicrobiia bacterium]|nr:hypothetical protein [Acidimicrobiia bacterium]